MNSLYVRVVGGFQSLQVFFNPLFVLVNIYKYIVHSIFALAV